MTIRKNFPSLNALLVLEAAARHKSFTAAAQELRVTQAAVSRQVAMLEEQLGTSLFTRKHRAIEPTASCQLLAASLAMNFANIANSVEIVKSVKQQEAVTIGATLAFSSLWLLPRLGDFHMRFPSTQIRVVSQDSRFNLNNGEVDVIVRFGSPPFDDGAVVASRSEEVFPVCSPAYASGIQDAVPTIQSAQDNLIGHDASDRTWYNWQDWFSRAGLSVANHQPRLRFNHYSDALQAARGGHGVALGWSVLVQRHLEDGTLVQLGEKRVTAEGRYNVVIPVRQKTKPAQKIFVDWLAENLSK